jgi:hypothetical protein
MVLCEYMKSIRNGVNNLSNNMHVRIKIYLEFYYDIIHLLHAGAPWGKYENLFTQEYHIPRGQCPRGI